jgi:hypothetical protein
MIKEKEKIGSIFFCLFSEKVKTMKRFYLKKASKDQGLFKYN